MLLDGVEEEEQEEELQHLDEEQEEEQQQQEEEGEEEEEEGESDLDGKAPTPKRRKLAREKALKVSLQSGLYPTFRGIEGPSRDMDPRENSALDYLLLLWPASLCELIALETNRYAMERGLSTWRSTSPTEVWTFLGIVILMGIRRLPRVRNYWSKDSLIGVPNMIQFMALSRFWLLWRNLHVVDNGSIPAGSGLSWKIKPILDTLSDTFLKNYSPGQELSVDEAMVKYKGHARGTVVMPKKPVKKGFKIWCCSCACCGYLCTFQVYHGRPTDVSTGRRVAEKGLAKRVVKDLVGPFEGVNHVVYCDNFYSSGPLVDMLAKDHIFFAGTIKKCAKGFPECLRRVKPLKGSYVAHTVDDKRYFVFQDRSEVSFVTNVFPECMDSKVTRLQPGGVLRNQSVPPLLPAYNKFMGGVDRTDQLRKTYGFDRKSKRFWLRLFFQFFDYAINNAYVLYKHSCKGCKVRPKDSLSFRLELVHLLLSEVGSRQGVRQQSDESVGRPQSERVCYLERVSEMGLKRGRCRQCQITKREPPRCTSFGCGVCRVRLCKTTCFADFHRY